MSETEMFELFDSSVADIAASNERLTHVIPGLPADHYARGVHEGWLHATDICLLNVPVYRIFWQVVAKTVFSVVAMECLSKPNPRLWMLAIDQMAAAQLCKRAVFTTVRRGAVEQGRLWGARVNAIVMEKKYE